jgi:hypothetical protein
MAKKKKSPVRCAIYEIGMQLFAYPEGVHKWTSGVGYITGGNTFFHHVDYRISGRIRIPIQRNHFLIDNFEENHEYTSIRSDEVGDTIVVSAVLVDFMCRNIGLSAGVPRKPKKIEISFEEEDFFDDLLRQIGSCFREDFAWTHLSEIMNRGVYSFGFAVILVDDLSEFHKKIREIPSGTIPFTMYDSGVLEFYTGSEIEDLRFPHFRLGIPALHLFVLENRGVVDWLDSGVLHKGQRGPFASIRKHIDYLLYSNRLRVVQHQMDMLNGRWSALLESMPERKPQTFSAREEQIQEITSISEDLTFYRSTHLLAKDFLLHEREVGEIPENVSQELKKEILEGELDILGERLLLLEQALQTKLMLENMTVRRFREEQQERTEKSFNILSLLFGTFFIFEVLASFYSWYLSPEDPFAWFTWVLMIFSPLGLIYLAIREFRKMTYPAEIDDKEEGQLDEALTKGVRRFCPHCKKGYRYKDPSGEVECQHCAKPFTLT